MPDVDRQLLSTLRDGCAALDLSISESTFAALLDYTELLRKWNATYNLTAVRDPKEMIVRHLLDSLSVAPWLVGERMIDVGTGAGLPGIPLSLLFPQREFHLLDSNGKKTRFLFQVKMALGLNNVTVHQARVETFASEQPFDAVLSRAFASLPDMIQGCQHLLSDSGAYFALKGAIPHSELSQLEARGFCSKVIPLQVPGLQEERHVVVLQTAASQTRTELN